MSNYKLYTGDCLERMNMLPPSIIDSIVTDPPYGLEFMGKDWDHGVPGIAFWKAALRVSKPGAHMLAFGGTRTHHRLMCNIEDAGWEIRDVCMWIYSSGFPKNLNVGKEIDRLAGAEREIVGTYEAAKQKGSPIWNGSDRKGGKGSGFKETANITLPNTEDAKQWEGWGTALKPAWEPIILARKPITEKNIALNVLKYGTGAINIQDSRIEGDTWYRGSGGNTTPYSSETTWNTSNTPRIERSAEGRWPANVLLDEELNESWAKYSYCSKAQKKDRDEGLDALPDKERFSALNTHNGSEERFDGNPTPVGKNTHPTVKPTDLMRYLCRMITPDNGLILDPFMGSGSTGKAAVLDNYQFIGIDIEQEYVDIARLRIEHALR
jgi:DNA modification methylase